ncbi:hypothetical protein Psi02_21190 [Planotetraspora silvatica]|uniref:Uncharacterized protein n=1 Tax=Planotetraspora silvatica TaxID=234614 RepID=A0A8J3XLZ2_9ACTN|nr:hypothetical protein [Planotetraspora silvatica]GII45695.1 hypothetical protein Psi02_21190 [Planotetraspora silvatica]
MATSKADFGLRAGDVVRVRGKEEILASLDADGRIDGLPFMPEMLAFAGQEMRVFKRADKTCDTVTPSAHLRKMDNTVHLVGARCDGSAHGGCQARCMLFFRTDWLEQADGTPLAEHSDGAGPAGSAASVETLEADAQAGTDEEGNPLYRCQATELLSASKPLSSYAPSQYVADVRSGNEKLGVVLRGVLIGAFNRYQFQSMKFPAWLRIRGGQTYPFLRGVGPEPAPTPPKGLQPGDLVEVKSKEEILRTLHPNNKNRGMSFDVEMLPYCGTRARISHRVEQIIDEQSGRMIRLRDCYVLENVTCTAIYHRFCPRAIYPYWRETWLRPVAGPAE